MANFSFAELVDIREIEGLLNNFYSLTGFPISITDSNGDLIIGIGWQDICALFHRKHPGTKVKCIESDNMIKSHLEEEKYYGYRCKNGLWDIAQPIIVEGEHIATLFLGQFFFDDDKPDEAFFIRQSKKYNFNLEEYLSAYKKVPVFTREKVDKIMGFYANMAHFISQQGYANLLLRKEIEHRKMIENTMIRVHEVEDEYKNIFEKSSEAIIIHDFKGQIIEVNNKTAELIGFNKVTLKTMNLYELAPKTKQPFLEESILEVMKHGDLKFETELVRNDRLIVNVIMSSSILNHSKGLIESFVHDITKMINYEKLLIEKESSLTSIFESIPLPVYIMNIAGVFTGCNQEFCKLMGKNKSSIINSTLYDLLPENYADDFFEDDKELLKKQENHVYRKAWDFNQRKLNITVLKRLTYYENDEVQGIVGAIYYKTEVN